MLLGGRARVKDVLVWTLDCRQGSAVEDNFKNPTLKDQSLERGPHAQLFSWLGAIRRW